MFLDVAGDSPIAGLFPKSNCGSERACREVGFTYCPHANGVSPKADNFLKPNVEPNVEPNVVDFYWRPH
jgi:hypothetical protein